MVLKVRSGLGTTCVNEVQSLFAMAVLALALVGCQAATSTSPTSSTHVYIAGKLGTSSSSFVPVYWKDGVLNYLPLNTGATNGGVWGAAEDSSGNLYFAGGQTNSPVGYWKNSTYTALTLGSTYTAGNTGPIAVDSSGNVWVVAEVGVSSLTTFVYWKNGVGPTVIPGSPDNVWGIQADLSGNVYFFGTEENGNGMVGYIWKNGANPTINPLMGGNTNSSESVGTLDSAGNVYAFANEWGTGTGGWFYWKVGSTTATALPTGNLTGWLASKGIAANSGNFGFIGIYGPGSAPTTLEYWANQNSTPIAVTFPTGTTVTNSDTFDSAYDSKGNLITPVQLGNTYVSGTTGTLSDGTPYYLQNSTPIALPLGTGYTWGDVGWVVVGP